MIYYLSWAFPGGASGKEPACQCRRRKGCKFDPLVRNIPWRRAWQPSPVFLPRESHGQRSLVGYTVHRVAKSQTWLKRLWVHTFLSQFLCVRNSDREYWGGLISALQCLEFSWKIQRPEVGIIWSLVHAHICWLMLGVTLGQLAGPHPRGLSIWPGLPHSTLAGLQAQAWAKAMLPFVTQLWKSLLLCSVGSDSYKGYLPPM